MTEHVHLWASDGQCRGCGLNANVLAAAIVAAVAQEEECWCDGWCPSWAELRRITELVTGRLANP